MTALEEALLCLAHEPWCWHPDQIARLTDHQLLNWYLKPAANRARAQQNLPPLPEPKPPGAPDEGPPPRAAVVGVMHHVLGMSVKAANAEYDRQLAEYERQKREGT